MFVSLYRAFLSLFSRFYICVSVVNILYLLYSLTGCVPEIKA